MSKIQYSQFLKALSVITAYKQQIKDELAGVEKMIADARIPEITRKDMRLIDCDISVRLLNQLRCYGENIGKDRWDLIIGDFDGASIKELMSYRGFGKKSLNELNQLCKYANIKLKP